MSYGGSRAQLFIGRLDKNVRSKELEDIFSRYGKLLRCDIKYGRQPFGLGVLKFLIAFSVHSCLQIFNENRATLHEKFQFL